MNGFLVNTNVISEFTKPQLDARLVAWLETIAPSALFASAVTFGEIRLGIEGLPGGKRRAELEQWIEEGLPEWFDLNLLPVMKAIADRLGRLTIQAKKRGSFSISTADGRIAGTALKHGLTLITRNVKDSAG